ncbi:MAG TPA: sensor histidine kinase [Acidimicrobiales bacterium]|nr:sensor histidine kinase [Acidimicrobiales bacterium]
MKRSEALRYVDAVIVLLLAISGQIQIWTRPDAWEPSAPVHAALLAAITVPLLVRRRYPLPVMVVVSSASWLQYELGGELFQPWFANLLGLYAVTAHAPLREAVAGGFVFAASVLAIDIPRLARGDPIGEVVPAWFVLGGLWGFGRWMRRRRQETEALTERAAALEREREREAQIAVAQERARIARELHDLVAHSMGVIVIQSQGAQRVLERDAEAVRDALVSIEAAGRQGMAELRRLLGMLTSVDEAQELSPQPTLERLDELVERVRAPGLAVDLQRNGTVRPVPPGVELAAYRIVQEALTNVLKHARATRVEIKLEYLPTRIDVEVTDDGAGAPAPSANGRGLLGMRERVSVYGGMLEVGEVPGSGFRVLASLPVETPNR